jgi:hypothetical protein
MTLRTDDTRSDQQSSLAAEVARKVAAGQDAWRGSAPTAEGKRTAPPGIAENGYRNDEQTYRADSDRMQAKVDAIVAAARDAWRRTGGQE